MSPENWSQPFGTFAYSPDAAVYVAGENGVLDLSGDVINMSLTRRTSQVSSARIELNNKYGKYDNVLQRMDRIVVFLKRTAWLQVFSGYLKSVPYLTVVPGSVVIEAECTIRRLKHTYWDPNAEENIVAFYPASASATTSPDGSTAATVYKLLTSVANWDSSQIWIQDIPAGFLEAVAEVIQRASADWLSGENPQILQILYDYVGGGAAGVPPGTGYGSQTTIADGTNPVKALPFPKQYTLPPETGGSGSFGATRTNTSPPHVHQGNDIMMPKGTPIYAAATGRVELIYDNGGIGGNGIKLYDQSGNYFYYAHLDQFLVKNNSQVVAGQAIAYSGNTGSEAYHLHFEIHPGGGAAINPWQYLNAAQQGTTVDATPQDLRPPNDGGPPPGDLGAGSTSSLPPATSPFTFAWQMYSTDDLESAGFMGDRAWINDTSLQESIAKIVKASLREYQSAPNGDFVAWFPDKYGMYDKTPAVQIRDIEIIDFKVSLDDENLRTHVAVAGTETPEAPTVTIYDWIRTLGIVSVEKSDIMKLLLGLDPSKEYTNLDGAWILQRFGLRPYREEAPEIHDPVWEFLLSYQLFQHWWTSQFGADVQFTFMPELYPGMRVELFDRNIAFYVEEVTHNANRTAGFTTTCRITCPMRRGEDGGWSIIPIERAPEEIPFDNAEEIILGRRHAAPIVDLEDIP